MQLASGGLIFDAHGINSDCVDSNIHTALLVNYKQRPIRVVSTIPFGTDILRLDIYSAAPEAIYTRFSGISLSTSKTEDAVALSQNPV